MGTNLTELSLNIVRVEFGNIVTLLLIKTLVWILYHNLA